jgi:molybdopterin-guanine dinucleotide biosynthesis protein A
VSAGSGGNAGDAIAAFVLAGGKSSRMGRDKALLDVGGEPVIVRTVRLAASVASSVKVVGGADALRELRLDVIGDRWPGAGPLGGIATALGASDSEWNLLLACDLPFVTREWLEYLAARARKSAKDAVVPSGEHDAEPLCAMYRKRCELEAREAVERGELKVQKFIATLAGSGRVEAVERGEWKRFDSSGRLFKNMNAPRDYEETVAELGGGRAKT